MTIDEAIEDFKTMAKNARNDIIDSDELEPQEKHYNSQLELYAKEKKQLAEWLEELKALRDGLKIKCDSLNEALEKGKKVGYNKALDDFVKFANTMPTVETEDGEIRPMRLEEMAEKLKAGGENENTNQKESR